MKVQEIKSIDELHELISSYIAKGEGAEKPLMIAFDFLDNAILDQEREILENDKYCSYFQAGLSDYQVKEFNGKKIKLYKVSSAPTKFFLYFSWMYQFEKEKIDYCLYVKETTKLPLVCLVNRAGREFQEVADSGKFNVYSYAVNYDEKAFELVCKYEMKRELNPELFYTSPEEVWAIRYLDNKKLKKGMTDDEEKDYIKRTTELAEHVPVFRQDLGIFYLKKEEYELAFHWLKEACGDYIRGYQSRPMIILGDCYRDGLGVEKDFDKARKLYSDAIKYAEESSLKDMAKKRLEDLSNQTSHDVKSSKSQVVKISIDEQIKKANQNHLSYKTRAEFIEDICFALKVYVEKKSPKLSTWMVWTICDNNIEGLVSECVDKIFKDYGTKISITTFDAQVGDDETFHNIARNLNLSDNSVLVIKNFTYSRGWLFQMMSDYCDNNERDKFYIVASSPLELPNGLEKAWDPHVSAMHSVLLSD